jgi:hypothetical protein
MKTEKARLDSAGTAKGKTEIVFHAKPNDCIPYAGSIGPLEYRETGEGEESPKTVRSPESATDRNRKVWVLSSNTAFQDDHATLGVFLSEASASKEKERLEAEDQKKHLVRGLGRYYFSIAEVTLSP